MIDISYYNEKKVKEIARLIYEATRLEADWSRRSVVPEKWEERDKKFRDQFINIIIKYSSLEKLPTPTEAHQSWMSDYFKMGWKYGEKRDVVKKTHPDLLPFDELPRDERDKDAIFLACVWLTRELIQLTIKQLNDAPRYSIVDSEYRNQGGTIPSVESEDE